MIKEAFGVGDTINDARLAALKELGLEEDQTEFDIETEIIEQPEKKILGLFFVQLYYLMNYNNSP